MFNIEKSTIILLVIIASGIITSIPFVESAIPPTVAYKTISVNGTQLEAFIYNDVLKLSSDGSITFDTVSADGASLDPNYPSWNYRKTITVDSNKVVGNLTDYPMLISITDSSIKDNAQVDGDDILFTDSDFVQLPHEIEKYDSATGELIAWVKVNLSESSDSVFYMYYGNSMAFNQEDADNTWHDDYVSVYHLHDGLNDSTSNGRDLINSGTTSGTGLIGGDRDFDGISDYAYWYKGLSPNLFPIADYPFTLSAIVDVDGAATAKIFMGISDTGSSGRYSTVDLISAAPVGGFSQVQRNTIHYANPSTTVPIRTGDVFYSVDAVYNNATNRQLFINGVLEGTSTSSSTLPPPLDLDVMALGLLYRNTLSAYWDGGIDEARFLKTGLSDDWIETKYNNYHFPSTFYSVSSPSVFGVSDEVILSVASSPASATTPRMIKHSVQPIDSQSFEITGLPIFDFLNIQGLITLNGSTSTKIEMEFNNDTGSNYSRGSSGNNNDIQVSFASSSKDRKFYQEWHNMNSKTGYQRVIVFDNGTADFHSGLAFEAVSYNGTDRIESIKLRSQSGVSVIESGSWVNVIGWNSTE